MPMPHLVFAPQPRNITYEEGFLELQTYSTITICLSSRAEFEIAQSLQARLKNLGKHTQISLMHSDQSNPIRFLQNDDDDKVAQGYQLVIDAQGITIRYSDLQGLFYGCMTLSQIIQQTPNSLPYLVIIDHPDFLQRGFMLDISRDRVPTMATLLRLIDDLASLKINHLQLYMEHTFAYPTHQIVWQHASPITPEELLVLQAYCAERFIELVPNQNSLGHMERWLKHPQYRGLSETPDGFEDHAGKWRSPSTLNPLDPESLDLIDRLYQDLLPYFDSTLFNVGGDEPWELGRGKSKSAYEERGGLVYLDWLLALYQRVTQYQRTMMFWGDIIIHYPDLIPQLPKDVIIMEWGYEGTHPFDERCELYAASGIPFYVCPGTSSWNALVGRVDNAIDNLKFAAEAGIKHGASGYLITDWGDNGHWQPLVASYSGILYGASVAWAYDANQDLDIVDASNLFYQDTNKVIGETTRAVGNIYKQLPPEHINGQLLAYALQWHKADLSENLQRFSEWGGEAANIAPDTLRQVIQALQASQQELPKVQLRRDDSELIQREWDHAIDLLIHGAKWLLLMQDQTDYTAQDMLTELTSLKMVQRDLWLKRSRRGGLEDSMARFDTLEQEYRAIIMDDVSE